MAGLVNAPNMGQPHTTKRRRPQPFQRQSCALAHQQYLCSGWAGMPRPFWPRQVDRTMFRAKQNGTGETNKMPTRPGWERRSTTIDMKEFTLRVAAGCARHQREGATQTDTSGHTNETMFMPMRRCVPKKNSAPPVGGISTRTNMITMQSLSNGSQNADLPIATAIVAITPRCEWDA